MGDINLERAKFQLIFKSYLISPQNENGEWSPNSNSRKASSCHNDWVNTIPPDTLIGQGINWLNIDLARWGGIFFTVILRILIQFSSFNQA